MSQYCQPSDLTLYAINPLAFVNVTTAQQTAACIAASERADSYLRGRYTLPLTQWGTDLTMMTSYVAVFLLLSARGYDPAAGGDRLVQERYYEAIGFPDRPGSGWFPGVQRQAIHPDVTDSAGSASGDPLPQVRTGGPASLPVRGWTGRGGGGWGGRCL